LEDFKIEKLVYSKVLIGAEGTLPFMTAGLARGKMNPTTFPSRAGFQFGKECHCRRMETDLFLNHITTEKT
jgi:hypothetical protein